MFLSSPIQKQLVGDAHFIIHTLTTDLNQLPHNCPDSLGVAVDHAQKSSQTAPCFFQVVTLGLAFPFSTSMDDHYTNLTLLCPTLPEMEKKGKENIILVSELSY